MGENVWRVEAGPPEVKRDGELIEISFSVGKFPIVLSLTKKQAKRIAKELEEAASAG